MSQLVIIAEFEAPRNHIHSFLEACHIDAEESVRNEAGCLDFVVLTSPDNDNIVILYEVYTGEQAFLAHEKTEHFAAFSRALNTLGIKTRCVKKLFRSQPSSNIQER